jgi:hypothetical protein
MEGRHTMSQSSTPEKKPYETPVLTKVGTVDEMTKGIVPPGADTGVLGSA